MVTPASVPPSVGPPSGPASGAPAAVPDPASTAPPSPEPPSGRTTLDSLRSLPPPPQATPTAMAAATAAGPTHRQPERMPVSPRARFGAGAVPAGARQGRKRLGKFHSQRWDRIGRAA